MKGVFSMSIAFIFAVLFLLLSPSYAQTQPQGAPPPGAVDEIDKAIEESIKKEEKAVKKEVKKEDLPPIQMVFIPGGCFKMGDFAGRGDDDESPAHEVCLYDYHIAETEVTSELFVAVLGITVKDKRDSMIPVWGLSWGDARLFIERLNKITGKKYRFPTEAEWEYAARDGGKDMIWSGTSNESEAGEYAWFSDNSDGVTHPVKQKKPNKLGLYDMSGNVWEWVEDYFDLDYYKVSPSKDPYGPEMTQLKTVRGGSALEPAFKVRTAYRFGIEPSTRKRVTGIRLAE